MMKFQDVARFDRSEINVDAKITDDGYIRANAIVTRAGVFIYRNPDGTLRREFRPPDEVFKADSLETLKMIPITNGHPPERLVTAKNAKRLAVGYTGEQVKVQEPFILANLLITDEDAVKTVKDRNRKELSLGYTVDLLEEPGEFNGERYDYKQTNIKYNHLSLVDQGRAGPLARIALDSSDAIEIKQEEINMSNTLKQDAEELMEPTEGGDTSNLRDEVERLKEERMELERRVKDLVDELERVKAERDSLKDRFSSETAEQEKNDAAEKFRQAVKERIKLEDAARKLLDKETVSKIDSMDDLELKKAIVKSRFPQANLDGQSDIYINGRYDGVIETLTNYKASTDPLLKKMVETDGRVNDPEAARQRMIEKTRNAWKR